MEADSKLDKILKTVYIGAEGITCPLGFNVDEVWRNILKSKSGLRKVEKFGFEKEDIFLGKFSSEQEDSLFKKHKSIPLLNSIFNALDQSLDKINTVLNSSNTLILFSTTKSSITEIKDTYPNFKELENDILEYLGFKADFTIVSNACISGVSAIITAHDLIQIEKYDHVIVIGADEVSPFTTFGFQSFFALSDEICKPYDENRKGINLGEGAACVVVSNDPTIYKNEALLLLGGTVANDANHISGPSRTGEGLYRSIKKTEKITGTSTNSVDFISAHGTATNYNDEMESIAFSRSNLAHIPSNSLKAYFGHTLGAAGLIEVVVSNKSLKENTLVKSLNFSKPGTSKKMNIIQDFEEMELNSYLKTASGFGGCNASIIISK
jgi:3-oxoacyl-[acyl-carrier-protein] synthase-1